MREGGQQPAFPASKEEAEMARVHGARPAVLRGLGCFLFRQGTVTEEFFKGPNDKDIPLKQPLAAVSLKWSYK